MLLRPEWLILLDHNSAIVPTARAELTGSSLDWRYPRGLDRVAGKGWVTGPPPPPPPFTPPIGCLRPTVSAGGGELASKPEESPPPPRVVHTASKQPDPASPSSGQPSEAGEPDD